MADSVSKAEKNLSAMKNTVATTLELIDKLQESVRTTIATPPADKKGENKNKINVLGLCHDAASLVRAHSTKISLLIINKPFTPTAVSTVLRELASGPLPGLASAIELCEVATYTMVMRDEVQYRVQILYTEFAKLVNEIPLDGQVLSTHQKNGTGDSVVKGSLASTGMVWEACDALIRLKKLGIAGLVVEKAEQYQATLKDALEELKEWGEEEADEEEDEGAESGEDPDDAQAAIDNMFAFQRHIPADDPDKIRERLESSLRRVKLVVLMYSAVIKRRFKTLPSLPNPELHTGLRAKSEEDPGIITCLDEVLIVLKKLPDITDELANAFYELDSDEINKRMDECFFTGFAAAELLVENWEGQKDEFSTWAHKFQIAMKKSW